MGTKVEDPAGTPPLDLLCLALTEERLLHVSWIAVRYDFSSIICQLVSEPLGSDKHPLISLSVEKQQEVGTNRLDLLRPRDIGRLMRSIQARANSLVDFLT